MSVAPIIVTFGGSEQCKLIVFTLAIDLSTLWAVADKPIKFFPWYRLANFPLRDNISRVYTFLGWVKIVGKWLSVTIALSVQSLKLRHTETLLNPVVISASFCHVFSTFLTDTCSWIRFSSVLADINNASFAFKTSLVVFMGPEYAENVICNDGFNLLLEYCNCINKSFA